MIIWIVVIARIFRVAPTMIGNYSQSDQFGRENCAIVPVYLAICNCGVWGRTLDRGDIFSPLRRTGPAGSTWSFAPRVVLLHAIVPVRGGCTRPHPMATNATIPCNSLSCTKLTAAWWFHSRWKKHYETFEHWLLNPIGLWLVWWVSTYPLYIGYYHNPLWESRF